MSTDKLSHAQMDIIEPMKDRLIEVFEEELHKIFSSKQSELVGIHDVINISLGLLVAYAILKINAVTIAEFGSEADTRAEFLGHFKKTIDEMVLNDAAWEFEEKGEDNGNH